MFCVCCILPTLIFIQHIIGRSLLETLKRHAEFFNKDTIKTVHLFPPTVDELDNYCGGLGEKCWRIMVYFILFFQFFIYSCRDGKKRLWPGWLTGCISQLVHSDNKCALGNDYEITQWKDRIVIFVIQSVKIKAIKFTLSRRWQYCLSEMSLSLSYTHHLMVSIPVFILTR